MGLCIEDVEVRNYGERRPFVGREAEMRLLRAGVEDSLGGRGRLLLLAGEPGIGKTRTCEEVATYADERGARVLWGRCYESEGAPAFWPWVQIIRSAINQQTPEALHELLGGGGADIAQVVPQLRERLPDLPVLGGLDSETARFRLFTSLAQFLANLARRTPLVVIIDDLQGADRSSLLLLQFVARELRHAPLLLVGSYRPVALTREHPLADLLGELTVDPATERIDLHGLSEAELAQFIAVSTGHTTPADFVTALHRQTEGTPLFVKEVIELLLSSGDADRLAQASAWTVAIPPTVKAMIGQRLASLSKLCSDLLTMAAVIGREFRVDVLEAAAVSLLPLSHREREPDDVLAEAAAARIVVAVPDSPGRYRFAHALFLEHLYGELRAGQRARLHRQVAEAIEQLPDAEEYLAELAHHFFEAGRDGDNSKAIAYAQRAGDRALGSLAYEEAARLYELGLDAVGRLADSESQRQTSDARESQRQRCALLLALGRARRLAGDVSRAKEVFLQAVELARGLQAAEPFARAVLGFGWRDSSTNADPLFVALLEEALRTLGEEDSALRVQLQGALANQFLRILERQKEGARLSREALAMARRVAHPHTLCEAFVHWYYTDYHPENLSERLAGAHEVVQLGERVDDPSIVLDGLRLRIPSLMELGDMPAMERDIEAYAHASETLRQTLFSWRIPLYRSAHAFLQGRFDEAERLGLEMLAVGQRAEEPEAVMLFSALLFSIRALQGRLDELSGLDAAAQSFLTHYSWNSAWRAGAIYGYAERSREREARTEFEKMAVRDFTDLPQDTNYLVALSYLARACAFLGDARRAAPLYRALLPYQMRNLTQTTTIPCEGSAAHYLGVLAATMARWDDAARHFDVAIEMHTRMGARAYAAISQREYAAALLARGARGDREKVLQLLEHALPMAQALGLKRSVETLLSLKGRCRMSSVGEQRDGRDVGTARDLPGTLGPSLPVDDSSTATLSPTSNPQPPMSNPRVFVGRDREMHVLRRGVEDSLGGRGRLLLLAGEPGIGKTRTCEELATYTTGRGAQVMWGRCSEDAGAPAFWPWVQILRASANSFDPDALRRALGDGAPDIAQLVPEIREQLPALPPAAGLDSPQARFRLFDSIARLLEQLARRAPLVVILDDIHGADHPSLLLLQFVVRAMRDVPLLVVGAYRDVTLTREHPLTEMIVEALRAPGTERLQLSGLSESEVERFIELTAAVKPSAAVVAAIHRQTEGNPLFVAEYVRLLLADPTQSGLQTAAALAIPPSVKAVIGRRLAPLSRECNAVLDIASVIGREFGLDVLEAAAVDAGGNHVASPPLEKGELADLLAEAVAARVLVEVPGPSRRCRFAHALIRETLYDELSPSRQMQLHRHVGEAIEQLPRVDEHLAELAHHFAAADDNKAVVYAQRAGDSASGLLAYEEAARLYQLGLSAQARNGPVNVQLRCEILLGLGEAQTKAGDIEQGKKTVLEAADLAKRLHLRTQLTRAALQFGTEFAGNESPAIDSTLVSLLEEADAAWGAEDNALRARLLARLALALQFSRSPRAAMLARRSADMARHVGDPASLGFTLRAVHFVCWVPDNLAERLAIATEITQLSKRLNDPSLAFQGHFFRFQDLMESGDRGAAERETRICHDLAEQLRQPLYAWQAALLQFALPALEGRFAEAEQLADDAHAAGRGAIQGAPLGLILHRFVLFKDCGPLATLEPPLRAFAEQFSDVPGFRSLLAYYYCQLDRLSDAREQFELLATRDFADVPSDLNWLSVMTEAAEVCSFVGDTRRAAMLYDLLTPYFERISMLATLWGYLGPVSHYLGLLAMTLACWDDAARHFEDAVAMNVKLRARPWLARTQYEYTRTLVARDAPGDREKALGLLSEAISTARALGMARLVDKTQALLDQVLRVQEATSGAATAPDTSPPTPACTFRREGDYWTIALDGTVLRLKNAKGLQYIAQLLRHPGQEILALDLIQGLGDNGRGASGARSRGSGPALDAEAKAAYKRQLNNLRQELDEAERANDPGRSTRVRTEIEAISEQIAAAVGRGGRDRDPASAAERARSTVTKGIKSALEKIRAGNPRLARHLASAIRTGYLCTYTPDPAAIVSWRL